MEPSETEPPKMHPSISRIISYPKIAQRTPEWYSYRKRRVTASEASTIIAQGKGYTRIFEEKVGIRESNFSSKFMAIGTDNEEVVVELYRKQYPDEEVFHDLSIIPHSKHDYVAASLDACTASGINVEIKTVFKDKFVKVSKAYRDQVQLQMEVADLDRTHLVQHYIRMPGQPIQVHEIERDPTWFSKNSDIFKKFVGEVRSFFPFDVEDFEDQVETFKRLRTFESVESSAITMFPFDLCDFKCQTDCAGEGFDHDVEMYSFEEG